MPLSYHFNFAAPASETAGELESFLKGVERYAKSLGFSPTTVMNVVFDTEEHRELACRLGGGVYVQDEKLKGVALPSPEDAANYNQHSGSVRLVPRQAVVLVVTDEQSCEVCFGFMKYPAMIHDINGKPLVETGTRDARTFRDCVDTPDKRYRQIVNALLTPVMWRKKLMSTQHLAR